jgi:TldD protein
MRYLLATTLLFCCLSLRAQQVNDPLISIVDAELKREMLEFKKTGIPPYFISYRINDVQRAFVSSSFGSLVATNTGRDRFLVTDVRVGDYAFDSSHPFTRFDEVDRPGREMAGDFNFELPLEDKAEPIALTLWQQTQSHYRTALEMFKALKNSPKIAADNVPDFSKEEPVIAVDAPAPSLNTFFNLKEWEQRIRTLSAPFIKNKYIVHGDANLQVSVERKYLITSEGTQLAQNRMSAYLTIQGSILADDGDIVPLHLSYFATDPKELPSDGLILADMEKMIAKLEQLRKAPLAEPYTGPAILHARAAGVFFHEIFGHRVEGHRLKNIDDGQTFKGKIGEQVLPKTLSVVFDPTMEKFNGESLNGYYRFDDEGVKAQKVKIVENGVFKQFLMSRTPLDNFVQSNGHGRAEAGNDVVSRQSNLIVENQKSVAMTDLRKMLIAECKKQKRAYGYLFMDVVGGFTTTGRYMPNAFNIFPTEVYRIYTDGRPDELVRGVDLIGTPLAMFAEITAADNKPEVFTGFCGAESGNVPVTAIAPSFFVKRIETQKKNMQQVEKTLLDRPTEVGTPSQLNGN